MQDQLVLANVNVQGLSPTNSMNRHKWAGLVGAARRGGWQVTSLSELRTRDLPSLMILCVEEYVILIWGRVGLMLAPEVARAWREAGAPRHLATDGRSMCIVLRVHGVQLALGSVYAPHGGPPEAVRVAFRDALSEVILSLPRGAEKILGGDWNAHFGRDAADGVFAAGRLMPLSTSTHSWPLIAWASDRGLSHVDSFLATRHRATWLNNVSRVKYELDYWLSDIPVGSARWRQLRTCALPFSDHFVKVVHLELRGRPAAAAYIPGGARSAAGPRPRRLRLDRLRGPTVSAAVLRRQWSKQVEETLPERTAEAVEATPMTWTAAAASMRSAAESVVGRRPRASDIPVLEAHRPAAQASREALRESWDRVRLAPAGSPLLAERKRAHAALRTTVRAQERAWRRQLVLDTVRRLDDSMLQHDLGAFYRGLRELGIWLSEQTAEGKQQRFTPEEGAAHFHSIGATPNDPDLAALGAADEYFAELAAADKGGDLRTRLGDPPSDAEIESQMGQMRVSAGGADEVDINMLRSLGPKMTQEVRALVRRMWRTPASEWQRLVGAEVVMGIVVVLYKNKGSRDSLDNYRGICLLSILSRVVGRVAASRLRDWAEVADAFIATQWGFRPGRGTNDVVLLARMLLEVAAQSGQEVNDLANALVLLLFDIKKAYPNLSRSLAWEVLRRLRIPEAFIQVLQGLHESTQYAVRTGMGDSAVYELARGLREGCPTSCVLYNLVHNVALWLLLHKQTFNSGVAIASRIPRPLPRSREEPPDDEMLQMILKVIGFADDTTTPTRYLEAEATERGVRELFASLGETVHPGKTERIRAQPWSQDAPPGFVKSVRLVGGWLDCDGGAREDTSRRIKAARLVWRKVWKQLPRLGLSDKVKGRVLEATVVACLLYCSEVRAFTQKDLTAYRCLLNSITRGVTYKRSRGGLRAMRGHQTMTDLRLELGMEDVEVYIVKRQLAYLGHVARYPVSRPERLALGLWLQPESAQPTLPQAARRLTLRDQLWQRVQELMRHSGKDEATWPTEWMIIAESKRHGPDLWRRLSDKVVDDYRSRANSDTWALRHGASQAQHALDIAAAAQCPHTGDSQCPRCQQWFRPGRPLAVHLRACAGVVHHLQRKRVVCPYCQKELSSWGLRVHLRNEVCTSAADQVAPAAAVQLAPAPLLPQGVIRPRVVTRPRSAPPLLVQPVPGPPPALVRPRAQRQPAAAKAAAKAAAAAAVVAQPGLLAPAAGIAVPVVGNQPAGPPAARLHVRKPGSDGAHGQALREGAQRRAASAGAAPWRPWNGGVGWQDAREQGALATEPPPDTRSQHHGSSLSSRRDITYAVWLYGVLEQRNLLTLPAERDLWMSRCDSCGYFWPGGRALANHLRGCVTRRSAENVAPFAA